MLIGPTYAANFIEIGVVQGDTGPRIVHAMNAREMFRR